MNCDFEYDGPSTKVEGLHRYRCKREGCTVTADTFLGPNEIISPCEAFPPVEDTASWLAIFRAALGIDDAAAKLRLLAWKAAGSKLTDLPPEIPRPALMPLGKGPGTELKRIFAELGITPDSSCNCDAMAEDMDRTWAAGTFEQNRPRYMEHLQTAYKKAETTEKIRALGNATMQGMPKSLEGLLDLAIARTRSNG